MRTGVGHDRPPLTRQRIVDVSLGLLDKDGTSGFSLPKLGRALGADPTAIYRHFASKDDLTLAIADRLIEEATTGMTPGPCWLGTLSEMARRLRTTYRSHPAAASLSSFRTTQQPAEMKAADIVVGAVLEAGFEAPQAAVIFQAIADFGLAWAGLDALFLALDKRLQIKDRSAWISAYLTVKEADFPNLWQVRHELPEVDEDHAFEAILSLLLAGLQLQAPVPCHCAVHAGESTGVDESGSD